MTKNVTIFQLMNDVLATYVGTVKLHMFTEVRMNKRRNPLYQRVKKVTTGTYMFGQPYSDQVNQLAGVDTFTSQPLAWGEWMPGYEGRLIQYNGNYYIRYYDAVGTPERYYTVDNMPATPSELETIDEFMVKRHVPHTQEAVGLSDEKYVHAQCVNVKNLFSITVGATEYHVI